MGEMAWLTQLGTSGAIIVFAEAESRGGLSWFTQLGNLTASSALVVMFGWLLYQMPKHFAEERKSREAVAKTNERAIAAVLAESRDAAKYEREACDKRHGELMERVNESHLILREVKHTVANLAQSEASRRESEKIQRRNNSPSERGHKS